LKQKILGVMSALLCTTIFASSFFGATPVEYPPEVAAIPAPIVLTIQARELQKPKAEQTAGNAYQMEPKTEQITPEPNAGEVELLACAIYQEAGGDACCDTCRHRVGDVILNRMADDRFPNTMLEVLTQERQYGRFYWTGVVWPERSVYSGEAHAVERAYQTAREVLSGLHTDVYGNGYIFQAEIEQGNDVLFCENCGIYYGK
jgi:hypothetical protein